MCFGFAETQLACLQKRFDSAGVMSELNIDTIHSCMERLREYLDEKLEEIYIADDPSDHHKKLYALYKSAYCIAGKKKKERTFHKKIKDFVNDLGCAIHKKPSKKSQSKYNMPLYDETGISLNLTSCFLQIQHLFLWTSCTR